MLPARFLGGLIGAATFGGLGWIAARLTVGMLIARHFNSAQHAVLETVWLIACAVGGFVAGAWIDPRRLTERLGWTCWGATIGLGILTIVTRLPLALIPGAENWSLSIPGIAARISLEEAGFVSAPAALLLGGCLGWYFFPQAEQPSPQDRVESPAGE